MKTSTRVNFIALMLIVAAICLLMWCAQRANGQTTQPATQPATLDQLIAQVIDPTLAGQIRASLTAAHVDPTKVKAVDPYTPPGELSAILKNATDNGTIYLTPGGVYPSSITANLKAQNFTIIGNGATIQVGGQTAIIAQGANLEIGGVNVTGGSCFVRGQAPGLKVHDCHAVDLWQFSILDWPATGAVFTNCTGVRTIKAFIFCNANNSAYHNLHIDGSRDEHCLRITGDGVHAIPDGALIDGGEWGYVPGSDKGSFAFRNITNLDVEGPGICHGIMTGGQASGAHNVTGKVNGFTFDYNAVSGGAQANWQAGVALSWTNNTNIITNPAQQAVSTGANSKIVRTGNTVNCPPGYNKKYIYPPTSGTPMPDDTKFVHP